MRLEVAYGPGRNHALVGTNSLRTRAGSDLSRAVAATVPVQPTGPSLPRLRLRYRLRHQVADGAGIDRRAVRAMLSRPHQLADPCLIRGTVLGRFCSTVGPHRMPTKAIPVAHCCSR